MKFAFQEAFESAPKGAPYDKWSDCVHKVGDRGGPYNPYAVCGASVHRTGECESTCGEFPFQWGFTPKKGQEAVTGSGMPQLARSDAK